MVSLVKGGHDMYQISIFVQHPDYPAIGGATTVGRELFEELFAIASEAGAVPGGPPRQSVFSTFHVLADESSSVVREYRTTPVKELGSVKLENDLSPCPRGGDQCLWHHPWVLKDRGNMCTNMRDYLTFGLMFEGITPCKWIPCSAA